MSLLARLLRRRPPAGPIDDMVVAALLRPGTAQQERRRAESLTAMLEAYRGTRPAAATGPILRVYETAEGAVLADIEPIHRDRAAAALERARRAACQAHHPRG